MKPPALVIAYHALGTPVLTDFAEFMVTPPSLVEAHVAALRAEGYELVSAGSSSAGGPGPSRLPAWQL